MNYVKRLLTNKQIQMKNQKKTNTLKTGIKVYLKGEKVTNVTSPYDSNLVYQQPLNN